MAFIRGSFGFAVKILNRCDAGVPIRSPLSESLLLLLQIILDVAHPAFSDVACQRLPEDVNVIRCLPLAV